MSGIVLRFNYFSVSTLYAVRITDRSEYFAASPMNTRSNISFPPWFYPIGTIYETTSTDLDTTTKMNAHFGGTWEAYGSGRVLVAKSADTEFDTIGETGGTKTHTLSIAEMPEHVHGLGSYGDPNTGGTYYHKTTRVSNQFGSGTTLSAGSGNAHNNLQPYIVVYRYRRVS